MSNTSAIPSDLAIHIVEKRMAVNALILVLYNMPTKETFEHFKFVNSHLIDGFAKPGQIVLISPLNTFQCTIEEQEFKKYALDIDKKLRELDEIEKEVLAKRYDLLSNVAKYNGLLLGVANNTWNSHVSFVKENLKNLEQTYVKTYNAKGNLRSPEFQHRRKIIFSNLNNALRRFGQPAFGENLMPGNIRTQLGLSSKSLIRRWDKMGGYAQNIPGFADHYKTIANMAKNLKRVGYVGVALTGVEATANIQRACLEGTDLECTKAKYVETGKGAGSIVGAAGGGLIASYGLCSIVFGLPSGGTSLLWCGIVAGGVGGYFGAKHGSHYIGDKAELLYEAIEK